MKLVKNWQRLIRKLLDRHHVLQEYHLLTSMFYWFYWEDKRNVSRGTKHMQAVTLCICDERLSVTNSWVVHTHAHWIIMIPRSQRVVRVPRTLVFLRKIIANKKGQVNTCPWNNFRKVILMWYPQMWSGLKGTYPRDTHSRVEKLWYPCQTVCMLVGYPSDDG